MVLPRPTPPHKYKPRGACAAGAGSQRSSARSRSPAERDESRRSALKRSSRTAASRWTVSTSSRWASTSRLRRDSTEGGGLATADERILKTLVVGTGTTLGGHPGNLPRIGVFDITGLAMHAVGGIDLQSCRADAVRNHFVDICRTEIGAGIAEFRGATRRTQRGVRHVQMHRLILIVRRRCEEYECQPVARRQFAVAPAAVRGCVVAEALERSVVGVIGERPREFPHGHGFQRRIGEPQPQSAAKSRPDIAYLVQFPS